MGSELISLIRKLDQPLKRYGMEINETNVNIMPNSEVHFISEIKIDDKPLIVNKFKYIESITDDTESTSDIGYPGPYRRSRC